MTAPPPIRVILIDDEPNSSEALRALLEHYCPEVTVIGQANSAEQGLRLLREQAPDLLFLDVEMPLGSGFDLLEALGGVPFNIVFITAHDRYALRAIKCCALDYLLKPVSVADLRAAVAKSQRQPATSATAVRTFYDNISTRHQPGAGKLVLPTLQGFEVVEVARIVRCEADDNYTRFVLTGQPNLLVSRTLKEYEELLSDRGFLRIHQSHLINADHVKRYIKGSGGYVQLSDDSIIEVSRRKKDELMKRFLPGG
ncbi:LytR/AlgR family response regulator transcription factor [Hymenobacter terrenus]|uniref:LytR/AlgR family response regulator transcription factor n=1 Tax=Hymenobacter terrenus TaxID=1629124 RepID=UPI000619EA7A|nr:LytTR family DNA-binding domain-containing protein [Hymenobacter terrenus]